MNLSYFISKRIHKTAENSFSSTIHKIAIASIAIGLAVMIVSFLILGGFQQTIKEKIFNFSSHLQVTKYTLGNTMEELPISKESEFYQNYENYGFIDHVQVYSHKAGLLKTEDEVLGVLLKGVGPGFDLERFDENIVSGSFLTFEDSAYSTDVLLSRRIANKLQLDTGDEVVMYFVQNPPRFRKLQIVGIYETGLEDFDDKVIIGDIGLIQRLNDWDENDVGGFEIFLKDYNRADYAEEVLLGEIDYDLYVEKVSDKYIQIFEWLTLLNRNVIVFLALILFVACFNMVSILLILIMERTHMIGVLKALGATNRQVQGIFRYNGIMLIVKGMVWGNIIGLGFGAFQYYFQLIPLDPVNYYMSFVPVQWDWPILILLNIMTFLIVTLVLVIPTMVIARIKPIKAIRFD